MFSGRRPCGHLEIVLPAVGGFVRRANDLRSALQATEWTMVDDTKRMVKVRLNASGTRLIGYVELLPHENRISDRLNDSDSFFLLETPGSTDVAAQCLAVFKNAVSYVEALEEPGRLHQRVDVGGFRWVTVELIRPKTTLMGQLFVPKGAQPTDGLNDPRRFINLKNVTFDNSSENYGYLALGKNQCRLWSLIVEERSA